MPLSRKIFKNHRVRGKRVCRPLKSTEEKMKKSKFPPGWDETRVRLVLEHYEAQSQEEALAEDEAAFENTQQTTMQVPIELVPMVRGLLAKHQT